jgi:hypothetical protein
MATSSATITGVFVRTPECRKRPQLCESFLMVMEADRGLLFRGHGKKSSVPREGLGFGLKHAGIRDPW